MIYSLSGELIHLGADFFVVRCSGIGFRCKSDSKTISELGLSTGNNVEVFTILNIRENSWDLFGFNDSNRVECFKMLTGVTGVGPKAALSILSQFYPDEIFSIIRSNQHSNLTCANGVGDKMAKRIVLELKDKIKKMPDSGPVVNNKSKAINALEVLGYSSKEVSPIVSRLDSSMSVESLIQQTLRIIGGNNE